MYAYDYSSVVISIKLSFQTYYSCISSFMNALYHILILIYSIQIFNSALPLKIG